MAKLIKFKNNCKCLVCGKPFRVKPSKILAGRGKHWKGGHFFGQAH